MASFPGRVQALGRVLLDFVYPPHCLVCSKAIEHAGAHLCGTCWGEILVRPRFRCWRCSCPLETPAPTCGNCASWEPVDFERALVLGPFAGALQQAVHALKFRQQQQLGTELGRRLGRVPEFARALQEVDLLVPVPLHPSRQRERGYNQSLCIARGVAEVVGRPLVKGWLQRRIHTRQQARLEAAERRENLRDAFQVTGEVPMSGCIGVVDDVVTTGATLNACARALQQAGCSRIWALALASPFRPPGGDSTLPLLT